MTGRALFLFGTLVAATLLSGCGGKESTAACTTAKSFTAGNVYVSIVTTNGTFVVELWGDKAPNTVCNFLTYVEEKFYDGTIFHRVVKSFVIQGGGEDASGREKETRASIPLETTAKLSNKVGTVAMARTNDPNSATSQFYVNTNNNTALDPTASNPGYAVFGEVVQGMDTVRAIENAAVQGQRPRTPIVMTSVTVTEKPA